MPLLETVLDLRKKGYGDSAIIGALKERGVSPREITNALSQASVKSAVDYAPETQSENIQAQISAESMQPSIMEQEAPSQIPQPQMPQQFQQMQQEAPEYIYPTQQSQYPEQYQYPQQAGQGGYETETMSELAEQIVAEKISDTNKKLSSLSEFRKIAEAKLEDAEQRLRKIESLIESLQLSILSRIGSYGKNLDDIKTEMQAMQDTFSKTLNPLMDRARKASGRFQPGQAQQPEEAPEQSMQEEIAEKPAKSRKQKSEPEFEDYLR